jgi:hypothetical protein
MWRIRWAPNNASKWQMGFNLAFKGLRSLLVRSWLGFQEWRIREYAISNAWLRDYVIARCVMVVNQLSHNVVFITLCVTPTLVNPKWGRRATAPQKKKKNARTVNTMILKSFTPGYNPQRRDTARILPNFCVVLCIVCFVSFSVLFVCICVLYYCHRVATQLQFTNISYHIISFTVHPKSATEIRILENTLNLGCLRRS